MVPKIRRSTAAEIILRIALVSLTPIVMPVCIAHAANLPPVITGTPATTVVEGGNYAFTPSASDPDSNSLTFTIVNKPQWARFNTNTGTLSGTPSFTNAGNYANITISVNDGKGGKALLPPFSITVSDVNRAPTISGVASTQVTEGSSYSFKPRAVDADRQTLAFNIQGKPEWATFDTKTGALTGTPNFDQAGLYSNIVISVSDGEANASLAAFNINVLNTNRAPTLSGLPPTQLQETDYYTFTPQASDADGDALTFFATGLPKWLKLDRSTGSLTGYPDYTDAGSYSINLSVTDGKSKISLPAFTITVQDLNRPPLISSSTSSPLVEQTAYSYTPVSSDPDGDKLSFSITGKPAWATFDNTTGTLFGTPPKGSAGIYEGIIIAASDSKDMSVLGPFDLRVSAVAESVPRGIYSIDKVIAKPFVDGVVVRPKWSEMEPQEGIYDFSKIEQAVRQAQAAGQKVSIANLLTFAPDWLIAKSETYQGYDGTTIVPWDVGMLFALERLAQAQAAFMVDGEALRDHPAIAQVNASIGGITSIRMVVLPYDYTAEKLELAVLQSLRAWADAYPSGKHLYTGLFAIDDDILLPSTAERLRETILAEFNGSERPLMHFFQELLTGATPIPDYYLGGVLKGVNGRAGVMFQACGAWSEQDGFWSRCTWIEPLDTPAHGFKLGVEQYRATYFEFYPSDLENPDYADQFAVWRPALDMAY